MKNFPLNGWLIAGIGAFGLFVVSHFAEFALAVAAGCAGIAIAAVGGYRGASCKHFFAGMALGLVGWIFVLFTFWSDIAGHALMMIVPVNFLVGFLSGAVGFFSGRLAARLVSRVRGRG